MDHLPLLTKLIRNIVREDNHTHAYTLHTYTHTHTHERARMFIYTVHLRGALYLLLRRVYILWNYCFRDTTPTTTGKRVFFQISLFTLLFFATKCDGEFFIVGRLLSLWLRIRIYKYIYIYIFTMHTCFSAYCVLYIHIIHSSSYIVLYPSHIFTLITVFRLLGFVRTVRFDWKYIWWWRCYLVYIIIYCTFVV